MNKLLKTLTALSVASVFSLGVASCKNNSDGADESEPFSYEYSLNSEKDGYTLTGYSISSAAKSLADKNDYAALAELFNKSLGENETKYTAETVRTFTVPEKYNDLPVTKIASNAVVNLGYIDKVVVTAVVEEIGLGAFVGLTSLKEIELPFVGKSIYSGINYWNNEKEFGYIFGTSEATGLTSCAQVYNEGGESGDSTNYYIPTTLKKATVTGDNKKLDGKQTIKYKLVDGKRVKADDDETGEGIITEEFDAYSLAVQPYSFYGCSTLEEIDLVGNYDVIYEYTFANCSALKTFAVPEGVTEIRKHAFDDCSALYSIDLKNVDKIGESAFEHCHALGAGTLAGGSELTTKATVVGDYACNGCNSLVSVKFENAAQIGRYAFKDCDKVKLVGTVSALVSGDETWKTDTDQE